jgi:hypothetical protein
MKANEIAKVVKDQNLSLNDKVTIEGPWASPELEEQRFPIYRAETQIGEVVVKIGKGMMFEVNLYSADENLDLAVFDVPMRFMMRPKGE